MAGQPRAHWKLAAESYVCETCGAGPGDPCLSVAGKVCALPHVTRTRLAAANNWRTAEEVDGFDSDEQV